MSVIYYRSNGTGTHFLFLVKEVKTVNLVSLVGLIENGPIYINIYIYILSDILNTGLTGTEHLQ